MLICLRLNLFLLNMSRKNMMILFFFSFFLCFLTSSSAQSSSSSAINQTSLINQTCLTYQFSNQQSFASCQDLHPLNSFIHWTFDSSSNIVDLAFRMTPTQHDRWVAWAINPTSTGMIGAQAFVAFQQSDSTTKAYTTSITSYGTRMNQGNLSFPVFNVSATYSYSNNEIIIFTKFKLPSNTTVVNHVWQEGPMRGNILGTHSMTVSNLNSFASIDFSTGKAVATSDHKVPSSGTTAFSRNRLKIIHGILNTIGWGTLMPLGTIFPILKIFPSMNPTWFYLHISCQLLGYLIGVSGGIIGVFLGREKQTSFGAGHSAHAYIGVLLLVLATAQVAVAVALRPKKGDKNRVYWNIFHWCIGYSTIGLGIYNVWGGLTILEVWRWKIVYIGILSILGSAFVILQALRCVVTGKRVASGEVDAISTTEPAQAV